jgi:hypothetical protein
MGASSASHLARDVLLAARRARLAGMSQPAGETLTSVIDLYCSAWGEPDTSRRAALLTEVAIDDLVYVDPRTDVRNRAALVAHITAVLERRPGSRVVRTTAIDAHHGLARFGWHAIDATGTPLINGIDIVELSADGRLSRIFGFFGPLAPR